MGRRSKLSAVFMLVVGLLLLGVVSCTPVAAPPEPPKELTVWWWGEGGPIGEVIEKYVAEMVKKFGEKHNVEVTEVLQAENTVEAFKAAAEAKEGPDIGTIWYGVYQLEEVWAGNVVPLDERIDPEETQHWIGTELSTYDGKLWGGDLYAYGVTMIYNKEQFAQAGLDPENPPKSWEEFLAACDALNEAGLRPIAWDFGGAGWGTAVLSGFIWPQTLGSLDALKEAAIGNRSFTEPEYKELFVKLDELNQRQCFGPSEEAVVEQDSPGEFQAGNGAMTFPANFNAALIIEEMGTDKVGLMYFPSITGEPVDWIQVAPITLFVTSWSPNPELATEFVKFLHSQEAFDLTMELSGGKIVPADDRFDTSKIEDPTTRLLADQIVGGFKAGTWFADSLLPYAILDGALPAGQKMISGLITPEEAAQLTEDAAQKWRENNPEALENYKKWASNQQPSP